MSHTNHGRLFKNTIFLYFRLFLVLGVSLYTSRIVLNALGIENYGIYNVVAGSVGLVAFLNSAMATSTQRFLSYEIGKGISGETSGVFSTAIFIHAGIAVLIFLAGHFLGRWLVNDILNIPPERLEAANWVLHCAILSLMVSVIQVPYTAVILSRERMDVYAYMSLLEVGAKLAIASALSLTTHDPLKLYTLLLFSTSLIVALIYAFYCHSAFAECQITRHLCIKRFKEMGSFVGWSLSSHIASVLSTQGVNMLLNIYFGPTVNAARGVAVQASGSLSGLFRNVQVASAPQIVKTYSAGQIGETNKLITFTCKISIFLIFILALPIFLEVDQVLNLWLVNPPTHTAIFIKLILIDSLINTSSYPMFQAIMATGHIKRYQLISSIAVIMGVLLTWFLLSNGAPPHSAFTTTIGISTFLFWQRLNFLNDNLHFSLRRYFQHVILPATKVMLAGGLIPMLVHINLPESTLRLGIVTLATFILTPVAVILFGLQKNETDLLRRKFTDKFRSFLSNIR